MAVDPKLRDVFLTISEGTRQFGEKIAEIPSESIKRIFDSIMRSNQFLHSLSSLLLKTLSSENLRSRLKYLDVDKLDSETAARLLHRPKMLREISRLSEKILDFMKKSGLQLV
jgi:hypothetical protein